MESGSDSNWLSWFIITAFFIWIGLQGWVELWIIVAIAAWYVGLVYLERIGTLDNWNATRVLGIILMIRTGKGKVALEQISRPRKFWRIYGEISIWICFIVMLGVVLLLFLAAISTALYPSNQEVLPARDILLIPGVTSFVPFWWPFIALIIALVIHEYSHGIQARAHGMQIRSFGLLLAGAIPVGAFAEPEYDEMYIAPRRERMRLYAAGPSINLLCTWIVLILLSATASGFAVEHSGVHASAIIKETGAEDAGLKPYETITHIDGIIVNDREAFLDLMENYSANDIAIFSVLPKSGDTQSQPRDIEVTFTDKWDYYMDICIENPECSEEEFEIQLENMNIAKGDAFLGVSGLSGNTIAAERWSIIFSEEYTIGEKTVWMIFAPILSMGIPISLDGHTMVLEERAMLTAGDGIIASTIGTDGMLAIFDLWFWLLWINFLLGFANLIPMIPFDGGHLVKDGTHSLLRRIMRKSDPIKIENYSSILSSYSSLLVLLILAIPIIIPRLYI